MKNILLLLLTMLLSSCFLLSEDEPLLNVSLSANKTIYKDGDTIVIKANILGDNSSYQYSWAIDSGKFIDGSSEFSIPLCNDSLYHWIKCKVNTGSRLIIDSIRIMSDYFSKQPLVIRAGMLSVKGVNLVDETGDPLQLRGMSLHGIQYFPDFYTEETFEALSTWWHADIVRIPCYVNEGGWVQGNYLENPNYWKSWIDTRVEYAKEYGMYVLIDWHMLTPGDPLYYLDEAKDFWDYMSKKYANDPYILFDICNEPNNEDENWNTTLHVTWKDNIKPYADTILNIIRNKNGAQNVAIVGTPDWAANPSAVIGDELDFKNIMYTMHFYAASHTARDRENMENALENGIPIFVTEFGTQNSSGEGANNFDKTQEWFDIMDTYKVSWINWNFSNDWRSGAVYKDFVKSSDSALVAQYKDDWGLPDSVQELVDNAERVSYKSIDDYCNIDNLKESGIWIRDKLINR